MKPWCTITLFASLLTYASMALAQIDPPAEISPDIQELLNAIEALPEDGNNQPTPQEVAQVEALPAFQGRDIGAVSAAGSFTQSGDFFTVRGSGEDIYGTADEFFYVYTQMTGDFTAIVRVGMDNTHPWAKAGLMVRQSLDANSPNGLVFVNPAGDAGIQGRATAGGNTGYMPGGSAEPGGWLKLVRQGNNVFGYWSSQPGDFVPPPTHFELMGSMTIPMSSSVYIGLAVTSHADGTLCNAGFGRLTIFSSGGGGGPVWRNEDIGNVGAPGSFSQGNTFIVSGSGFDIWGTNDEFHFAYQSATNDAQIVARILGIDNTNPWAKAGVMLRESLGDWSPNVLLALTPSHGLAFQWRAAPAGPTFYINAGPASAPVWVKLVRSGNTFTGYRSADGVSWTQVGTATLNIPGSAISAGLAVTSHNDGVIARGTFDNVTVDTGSAGGGTNGVPTSPSSLTATATSSDRISLTWQDNSANETGFILERSTNGTSFIQIGTFPANNETAVEAVVPGTHHWYRVAATNAAGVSPYSNVADATTPTTNATALPPPWQDRDIGTTGGSATYTNGKFIVIGSGADIYGNSDQFNFAFQSANGDQTIIAALDSIYPVSGSYNPWARIGLMIRETLDPNSKNAMVFFSAQHGTGFTWREATGGSTQYIPGNSWTRFLRLDRRGNTFTAYWSPDDHSWQLIGSATINMASSVYIGMAVTSHNTAGKVAGEFSQVSVTAGGGGGGGSTLPPPWFDQDVGAVGVAGSAGFSQGTFTVKGSGADIWGSADAFHFVYLTVSGPGELVARVTGLEGTNPWAKAGIMVRRSQLAESANVFVMATAAHGTGFQARLGNGDGTSYVPGPFWTAPVWLKLRRSGNVVTGFASLNGTTWTMLGTQSIPMLDPILIGLAVTSHNNSVLNTATFDNVTFTPQ